MAQPITYDTPYDANQAAEFLRDDGYGVSIYRVRGGWRVRATKRSVRDEEMERVKAQAREQAKQEAQERRATREAERIIAKQQREARAKERREQETFARAGRELHRQQSEAERRQQAEARGQQRERTQQQQTQQRAEQKRQREFHSIVESANARAARQERQQKERQAREERAEAEKMQRGWGAAGRAFERAERESTRQKESAQKKAETERRRRVKGAIRASDDNFLGVSGAKKRQKELYMQGYDTEVKRKTKDGVEYYEVVKTSGKSLGKSVQRQLGKAKQSAQRQMVRQLASKQMKEKQVRVLPGGIVHVEPKVKADKFRSWRPKKRDLRIEKPKIGQMPSPSGSLASDRPATRQARIASLPSAGTGIAQSVSQPRIAQEPAITQMTATNPAGSPQPAVVQSNATSPRPSMDLSKLKMGTDLSAMRKTPKIKSYAEAMSTPIRKPEAESEIVTEGEEEL